MTYEHPVCKTNFIIVTCWLQIFEMPVTEACFQLMALLVYSYSRSSETILSMFFSSAAVFGLIWIYLLK